MRLQALVSREVIIVRRARNLRYEPNFCFSCGSFISPVKLPF